MLELFSQKHGRLRGIQTEVYNITGWMVFFPSIGESNTRGHRFKEIGKDLKGIQETIISHRWQYMEHAERGSCRGRYNYKIHLNTYMVKKG